MKGGIVERQPVAPKPLGPKPVPIAKPIPLPPLQPAEKKPIVKSRTNPSGVQPPLPPPPSEPSPALHEYSENDELIKNMSPEEIQEALAEISSLLSKESIDFLMGKKGKSAERSTSAAAAALSTADESDDDVPDLEPQSSATPAAPSTTSAVVPSVSSQQGQIMALPEEELFDLDGRRVLMHEEAYVLVANALAKHHASFLSMDPDRLIAISRTILTFFEREHFVWRSDVEEGNFFSLPRALEMSRSQVKMQMISSYKILRGVLMRRDLVISLPTYASGSDFLAEVLPLFPRLASFHALAKQFNACVASLTAMLGDLAPATVGNVVCHALLALCATDLPAHVPKLMLFGWRAAATYNPTLLTARLECLCEYMTSLTEHHVARALEATTTTGGDVDIPRYIAPHVTRPAHLSYEQWHLDRLESLEFILRDKKRAAVLHAAHGGDATAPPLREDEAEDALDDDTDDHDAWTGLEALAPGLSDEDKFVLRNRWARVDIVVENEDVVALVHRMLVQALDDDLFRSVARWCLDVVTIGMTHGSETSRLHLQQHVVHPLCSLVLARSGGAPAAAATAATAASSTATTTTLQGDVLRVLRYPELLATLLPLASSTFIASRFVLLTQALHWPSAAAATAEATVPTDLWLQHHHTLLQAVHRVLAQLSATPLASQKSSAAPPMEASRLLAPLWDALPWDALFRGLARHQATLAAGRSGPLLQQYAAYAVDFFFRVLYAALATASVAAASVALAPSLVEAMATWIAQLGHRSDEAAQSFGRVLSGRLRRFYLSPAAATAAQQQPTATTTLAALRRGLAAAWPSWCTPLPAVDATVASVALAPLRTALETALLPLGGDGDDVDDAAATVACDALTAAAAGGAGDGAVYRRLQRLHDAVALRSVDSTAPPQPRRPLLLPTLLPTLTTATSVVAAQTVRDGLLRRETSRLAQRCLLLALYCDHRDGGDPSSLVDRHALRLLHVLRDNVGVSLAYPLLTWLVTRRYAATDATLTAAALRRAVNETRYAVLVGDPRHALRLQLNRRLAKRLRAQAAALLPLDGDGGSGEGDGDAVAEAGGPSPSEQLLLTWPLPSTWVFRGLDVVSLPTLTLHLRAFAALDGSGDDDDGSGEAHATVGAASYAWYQLVRLLRREAAARWYLHYDDGDSDEATAAAASTRVVYDAVAALAQAATYVLRRWWRVCLTPTVTTPTPLADVDARVLRRLASDHLLTAAKAATATATATATAAAAKDDAKRRQDAALTLVASLVDNACNHTLGDLDRLSTLTLWLLAAPMHPVVVRRKLWQELAAHRGGHLLWLPTAAAEDRGALARDVAGAYRPLLTALLDVQRSVYWPPAPTGTPPPPLLTAAQFSCHSDMWRVVRSAHGVSRAERRRLERRFVAPDDDASDASVDAVNALLLRFLLDALVDFVCRGATVATAAAVAAEGRVVIDNAWSIALLKELAADWLVERLLPRRGVDGDAEGDADGDSEGDDDGEVQRWWQRLVVRTMAATVRQQWPSLRSLRSPSSGAADGRVALDDDDDDDDDDAALVDRVVFVAPPPPRRSHPPTSPAPPTPPATSPVALRVWLQQLQQLQQQPQPSQASR